MSEKLLGDGEHFDLENISQTPKSESEEAREAEGRVVEVDITGFGKVKTSNRKEGRSRYVELAKGARIGDSLGRKAMIAEDFRDPETGEVWSRSFDFEYVRMSDGVLHQSAAKHEILVPMKDEYGDADDALLIAFEEKRTFAADGRVLKNERTERFDDGTRKTTKESLSYDKNGNVNMREKTIFMDGKEAVRSEARVAETADPNVREVREAIVLDNRSDAKNSVKPKTLEPLDVIDFLKGDKSDIVKMLKF